MEEKTCRNCGRKYKSENDYMQNTTRWRVCEAGNLWFNCTCDSTLVLTASNYRGTSLENKQLNLSEEARGVFETISRIHSLPHLPTVVMELQRKLEDIEVSAHELAHTVRKEPFISAQVLSIFNNLCRVRGGGSDKKKTSLEHAISYIGRKSLANLVMIAYFEKIQVKTSQFSLPNFWADSLKTAGIAEWLCRRVSYPDKERAYLAGYLCNLGKIVEAVIYPKETDELWLRSQQVETQSTWSELEKEMGLPDHCILGEIGLAFWGLPDFLHGPVRNHHDPEGGWQQNENLDMKLIHLISLSNMLTHWINLEPSRFHEADIDREREYFNLQKEELDDMAYEIGMLFRPVV